MFGFRMVGAALLASALVAIFAATASASYDTYLRPTADYPGDRWTITGASTAWEALDDPVTEAATPNNADFISNSTTQSGNWGVDIGTSALVGDTINSSTAYFYLSTAAAVKIEVRVKQNPLGGDTLLASSTQSGVGWHSVSINLKNSQALLDEVYFRFLSGTTTSTRTVSAAFLKLNLEPSAPKVYWGAWIDGEVYGSENDAPWDPAIWSTFEEHTKKDVSIVHFGQPAPWNQVFKEEPLNKSYSEEALPLMDMNSGEVSLQEIASGTSFWDTKLKEWSEDVAEYGKPFFLRWNWEMNLMPNNELPWTKQIAANPKVFIEAWQRFHKIADAAGASNITWVWCPNTSYGTYPSGSTPLSQLWPGSEYVDWTCIDGYNFGTNPLQPDVWKTFSQVFSNTYAEVTSLAPTKPLMIGETASTESGGDKAQWITDALTREVPLQFPKIKAFVWFNWNIKKGSGRMDWPIESLPSAEAAFSSGIGHSYYQANWPTQPISGTKIQPLP
jgi:hypothetical protein